MRNMKKILSFLLVLSMVLSYVPMPALAAEGDPCTVTEGCEGTYNAEGICTVCNLAQPVVTEGAEECQHSGGTATCTALAVCEKCNETYGELAAHTGGEATCKAQAVCAVCTAAYGELAAHSYENGVCAGCGDVCAHAEYAEGKCTVCGVAEPHVHTYTDGVCGCGEVCNHVEYAEGKCTVCGAAEPCTHSGGTATCKEQAICEKSETAYGELAAHNYGTDADGKCDACGAGCSHSYAEGVCRTCGFACVHESYSEGKCATCNAACTHAEYQEGKCKICGMDEPVQEPVVLTITAWSWNDENDIISEDGTYATLPNAADWETLKSVLPTSITATVDGAEVEIPVQWECETFPAEGEGQGTYELKAILPEGYALGESVSALKLEVDMGVAEQLATITGKCGSNAFYTLTDDGVLTITGSGAIEMNAFSNNAKYSQNNKDFTGYLSIKQVIIENGITGIGQQAFSHCSNIISVRLPSTATNIQTYAFTECSSLETINFPEGLTSIGNEAFYACKNLESVHLPSTLKQIGGNTFQQCSALKEAYLAEGIQTAGYGLFSNCTALTSITLPASLTSVAYGAFNRCTNLTSVTIKGNTSFASNYPSFSGCDNQITFTVLCDYDVDAKMPTISRPTNYTFSKTLHSDADNDGSCDGGCGAATVIEISLDKNSMTLNAAGATETLTATITPSGVSADVTWNSSDPTVATASNGVVTAVGAGTSTITAEAGGKTATCTVTVSLPANPVESVSLSKTSLRLGVDHQYELDAIITPDNADNKTVAWSSDNESVATVDADGIVKGVTVGTATITVTTTDGGKTASCEVEVIAHEHIWDSYTGTCSGCDMTHNTHGAYEWTNGVCSVCGVVGGCCGYVYEEKTVEYVLTSVDQGSTYTITISGNGRMGEYNSTNQPWSSYSTKITTAVVKNGVQDIGWGAFKYHSRLTGITIPDNITKIGPMAFEGTSALHSITLPSALTSLGSRAFWQSGIQSITVPAGVTSINYDTFYECSSMSNVTFLGNITSIGTAAFYRCGNLKTIILPDSLNQINSRAFAGAGLTSVTIPSNVTKIDETAFQNCSSIQSVTISGSDLTIANRAFANINALETLTINNTGTVTLGDYAFGIEPNTVDKLNSITLPANVTYYNDSYAEVFENRNIPAESVSLNKSELTLYTGGSETLIATVLPAEATNKNVTWSSNAEGVAAVDQTGKVSGIAEGTATITATTVSGGHTATCTVTVLPHAHSWSYEAKDTNGDTVNDTIEASCVGSVGNCPTPNGGRVTLSVSDDTYNGTEIAATATETNWIADNVVIQYQKQTGIDTWSEATANAPTDAGTYRASISLGSDENIVTIVKEYEIIPKTANLVIVANGREYQKGITRLQLVGINFNNWISGDTVTLNIPAGFEGTLPSDAVGIYDHISIDISKLSLSGEDAANYKLPESGNNLPTQNSVRITGTISKNDVYGIDDSYTYTGDAIQPVPTITVNDVTLVEGTDYEISYGYNTDTDAEGTVTIKGKGLYSGEIEKTFSIAPLEIKAEHITLNPASAVFDGNDKSTAISVVIDGKPVYPQNYDVEGLTTIDYIIERHVTVGSAIGKYPITVKGKGNYTGTATKNFEITAKQLSADGVTLTGELTYHGEEQEPTITVKDGNIELTRADYTVSYEKVNENASATPINGAPTDAGTYNAIITGKGNYGGEIRKSFEIKPNATITVEPETLDDETYTGEEIKPAVTVKGVKLTALEKDKDYTIAYENNINAGTAKITITGIGNYAGATEEMTFTINAKALTEDNVSIKETVLTYREGQTTVPEITVKDGDKTLVKDTDYVVVYKDKNNQNVDAPSEIGTYTVEVVGIAALSEDGNSNGNYTGTVSYTFIITDDVTDPTIEGVTNGKTYYTTQKAIAKDTNLVSVTKNGAEINPVVPAGTEVTLQGNTTATYTVTAVDIAELDTSVTITMKPISTLDDTIENLTAENAKLSDKTVIQAVLDKVNPIRKDECGNATQAETDALDAIIKKCNDLLKVITDVEDAISKIQAMPNPSTTEPDDEKAVTAYNAAKAAYDALSAHGKELVGEENKAKLDAMLKALTAYDIIKQSSKSYVKGSYKALIFTANGYFGKFTGIEIDGKAVDAKYYDAKSGSTIITLKTSYLESLSVGKHTIKVNYIDGSTDGEDTFRISVNNGNPFTGDDTHMMLFGGMALTSLLCMAMMIVFFPRKKGKYQR